MSILGSMTTAVLGLTAQSRALGHISDNIANAQTTGYKRVDTSFNTLVLRSDADYQPPGGVVAQAKYSNNGQGSLSQVESSTHVALQGQGFFTVTRPVTDDSSTSSAQKYYTRVGDFDLDDSRYLTNSAGFRLNGFIEDPITGKIDTTGDMQAIQILNTIDRPVPTTNIDLFANLPATPKAGEAPPDTTIKVFDNNGEQQTIQLKWRQQGNNDWRLSVVAPDAVGTQPMGPGFKGETPLNTMSQVTPGSESRKQINTISIGGTPTDNLDDVNAKRVQSAGSLPDVWVTRLKSADAGDGIDIGDSWQVELPSMFPFPATTKTMLITDENIDSLRTIQGATQALADLINADSSSAAVATVNGAELVLTSKKIATVELTNFPNRHVAIGDTYTVTVDNIPYSVTVSSANADKLKTFDDVAEALADKINAADPPASAIADVKPGTFTQSARIVLGARAGVFSASYALSQYYSASNDTTVSEGYLSVAEVSAASGSAGQIIDLSFNSSLDDGTGTKASSKQIEIGDVFTLDIGARSTFQPVKKTVTVTADNFADLKDMDGVATEFFNLISTDLNAGADYGLKVSISPNGDNILRLESDPVGTDYDFDSDDDGTQDLITLTVVDDAQTTTKDAATDLNGDGSVDASDNIYNTTAVPSYKAFTPTITPKNGTPAIQIGEVYSITIDSTVFSETITKANVGTLRNYDGVIASLADKINASSLASSVIATTKTSSLNDPSQLVLTAVEAGEAFDAKIDIATGPTTANAEITPVETQKATITPTPKPNAWKATFFGPEIDIGDRWEVSIPANGSFPALAKSLQVTTTNYNTLTDIEGVVRNLADQINADPNASVTATIDESVLTLTSKDSGGTVSFTPTISVTNGSSKATGKINERQPTNILGVKQKQSVSFAGGVGDVGAVYEVSVNSPELADFSTRTTVPDVIINKAIVSTTRSASATQTQLSQVTFQQRSLEAGDVYAVMVGGERYEVVVNNSHKAYDDVVEDLVTMINADSPQRAVASQSSSLSNVLMLESTAVNTAMDVQAPQIASVGFSQSDIQVGDHFEIRVKNGPTLAITITEDNFRSLSDMTKVIDAFKDLIEETYADEIDYIGSTGSSNGTSGANTKASSGYPDDRLLLTLPEGVEADFFTVVAPRVTTASFTSNTLAAGQEYKVKVDGTAYSVLITEDNLENYNDINDVLDGLRSKIEEDTGARVSPMRIEDGQNGFLRFVADDPADTFTVEEPDQQVIGGTFRYTTTGDELSIGDIAERLADQINSAGLPIAASVVNGTVTLASTKDSVSWVASSSSKAGLTPGYARLQFGGTDPITGETVPAGTIRAIDMNAPDGSSSASASQSAGETAMVTFNVDFGSGAQEITLNLGEFRSATGVTQFAGEKVSVSGVQQNGSARGQFENVEVDKSGNVVVNFNNGRSRTVAQIGITLFNNPNGLTRESGGVFTQTAESGDPSGPFLAGTNGAAQVISNSLEGSNVDIADEFTKLIVTQRTYTANTRIVTTSDQMLQDALNMVR